jgi:ribosomal protein S27E
MYELERQALAHWRSQPWALFTICPGCDRPAYCYGRTRERVRCLPCFDGTTS